LWERYVDEVASRTASVCNIYQLLNEPNNPVFKVFPLDIAPTALIAGKRILRQYNPGAQVTTNILAGIFGWRRDLEDLLRKSGSAIDITGLDYYPGTWTVSSSPDLENWNRFIDYVTNERAANKSPLHGRPVAILETGYATNVPWWRSEEQQLRFVQTLAVAMNRLDQCLGHKGLLLVGIHEVSDAGSQVLLDPEAHFGLLASTTLKRKPAFEVTKKLFATLQK
jgi:hypothetical protein